MTEIPDHQPQPRVPGVRYRTETRYRPVTTWVFGEEQTDYEPYEVDVPLPPRDWDRVLWQFLLAVAVGSTCVAVVWSTVAISGLLDEFVTTPGVPIAAASLFELLWLVCLVAEWLMRRRPERARPLRIAGWIAVWFVVAAVVTEGAYEGYVAAGIVGGAVSLMAKGSWWVIFRIRNVELRRPIAAWLHRQLEDMSASEALLEARGQMGGRQAYAEAIYGPDQVRAARATVEAANRLVLDPPGPRPDGSGQPSVPVQQPAPTRVVQPTPAPSGPAPQPTPATTQPAAPPADPAAPAGTSADPSGTASGEHPDAPGPEAPRPEAGPSPVLPMAPSIRQIVAKALDEDVQMPFEDLLKKVQDVHGDRPKLAGTVERYQRSELKTRKAS